VALQPQYPSKTTKAPLTDGKGNPAAGWWGRVVGILRGQQGQDVLGPGEPLQSYLTQDPTEDSAPRQLEYPYSSNILLKPRSEYPELTPFDQLRALSANYDVIQICHQTLKAEIAGLDWSIMPKDASDIKTKDLYKDEAKKATDFIKKPDGEMDLPTWVSMLLGEDLEIGAPAVYKHRTRGSKLGQLEIIQGDTIKPVIDYRGKVIAYQQVWRGLPGQVWKKDDFIYTPRIVRRTSVYGKSPVEEVMINVNTALRKQTYELAYYQEGNVPDVFMGLDPEKWTIDQIKTFQAYWDDLLSGKDGMRRKVYFYPGDPSKSKDFRQRKETTDQEMWLLQITCAAHGINPEELGFTMHVNRATGEMQSQAQRRKGVTPIVSWVEQILSSVIQNDLGYDMLCFKYKFNPAQADVYRQAQADQIYMTGKVYDAAFIRDRDGVRLGEDSPILVQERYVQDHPELMQPAGLVPPNLAGQQQYPGVPNRTGDPNQPNQPQNGQNPAQNQPKGTYTGGPQKQPDGQQYAPKASENSQKQPEKAQNEAKKADLRRWREKSLAKVKAGKGALVHFTSEVLDPDDFNRIAVGLDAAVTADDVRAVFAQEL
jgi:hypothetical protein